MPDDDRADALARTLVEERLAACVNVHGPMRLDVSMERADRMRRRAAGRDQDDEEQLAKLEARLRALHPYELPGVRDDRRGRVRRVREVGEAETA
jgi:periplasmic divalent cation tolerance protein